MAHHLRRDLAPHPGIFHRDALVLIIKLQHLDFIHNTLTLHSIHPNPHDSASSSPSPQDFPVLRRGFIRTGPIRTGNRARGASSTPLVTKHILLRHRYYKRIAHPIDLDVPRLIPPAKGGTNAHDSAPMVVLPPYDDLWVQVIQRGDPPERAEWLLKFQLIRV
jgi:hypothetical protein